MKTKYSIFCLLVCVMALLLTCTAAVADANHANGFTLILNPDGETSIEAGQQGDYPVWALEAMAAKDKTVTLDGVTGHAVQGSNNPKKDGENAKGVIPTTGAAMYVTAPADGVISVTGINGKNKDDGQGKTFWQVKTLNGEILEVTSVNTPDQITVPVEVKAGETVWFYCNGSKFQFAVISFVPANPPEAETDPAGTVPEAADFIFRFNADGETSVKAGLYQNDAILVLEDMSSKDKTITLGEETLYVVQGSNNPKADGKNAKGVIPENGAAVSVTAPADGVITVHGINGTNKDGTGKTFWQVTVADGVVTHVTTTDVAGSIAVPVEVKTGQTVWFYCDGSKFQFAAIEFHGAEASSDASASSAAAEPIPMKKDDRAWEFSYFGTSTSKSVNRIGEGASIDGKVTLYSCTYDEAGRIVKKGGKFVQDAPADGVSFYYTTIDPTTENFRLMADVTIDYMNPTPDGQEGFAIQLRDTIEGSGSYFSNTMSVGSAKLYANGVNTYSLLGTRNYTGIVDSEKADANQVDATLEAFSITPVRQGQTYRLCLEKTSYGYVTAQYRINADGSTGNLVTRHTYYIPAKELGKTSVTAYSQLDDPMTIQEGRKAYLGFAVARGMNVTFSNIEFVTGPWNAAEWMVQPTTYIDPSCVIKSGETVSGGEYTLVYQANADGLATITIGGEVVEKDLPIKADVQFEKSYLMAKRGMVTVTFNPDPDFKFGPFEALSIYETQVTSVYVNARDIGAEDGTIYVTPKGRAMNDGTSWSDATDVYTALGYAKAGQKIILKAGRYVFDDEEGTGLLISRGHDGTEDAPIIVTCEDGFATFDFCRIGSGFTCWGDWWQFSYINICNTVDKQKGMQLAGKHCTLSHMNFYNNGTTGLQISGTSQEPYELWPAHNTVMYCTAMNNGDSSYEDADGFAAKLTCGPGNVFVGCVAAYNADDGWDMFAKAGTGEIGTVEIRDSLCYRNGYLMVKKDSTKYDIFFADMICDELGNLTFVGEEGKDYFRVEAGNGNGFKMGGTNMPGNHKLFNCISYENKGKGIDSNSCPDVKVYDCTSFNNGSYNVAFYTNNKSTQTDYRADGLLSFRTENLDKGESVKLNQVSADVYGESNYYWDGDTHASRNTSANSATVEADWFEGLDTSVTPTREKDGTMNMHGLLMLTETARALETGAQGKAWGQAEQEKATFWVVGDSTVCGFSDSYYIPRMGWGEQLDRYFSATVYNLAHSGASSKDFTSMAEYAALLNGADGIPALGDADGAKFLFIGFGHNDEKTEIARYTNPNGDHTTEGSFAHSLYTRYIQPALDAGVTPVLVTPIARLTTEDTYESYDSASGHITEDVTVGDVTYAGGDYAAAIRKLARDLNLICIDLTQATIERNVEYTLENAQWFHAWNGAKYAEDGVTLIPTALDKTHTNAYGAKDNAYMIASLSKGTALEPFVKPGKSFPTYEAGFADAINTDYVPVSYTVPTAASTHWPVYTDAHGQVWYGTVFGDVGGEKKVYDNFFAKPGENALNIGVTGNAGKISSATDGMIFYYTALPAGTSFTLTATATINSMAANNQVSFGLMARDDLYIDAYVKDTMGDYVAVGTRNQGAFNSFGRKSGVLYDGPAAEKVYAAGDTVELKLIGTADGFTLVYGDNEPVSAGFDYALTSIDAEHIYVGFYAVRNVDVTFSNICLVQK